MTEPDSYEIAMKHAELEDEFLRQKYPGQDIGELEGEWLKIEDSQQKLIGPWSQDHSFILGMIDTLVGQGIPREAISVIHGKRNTWKLEGLDFD